MTAKTTYKNPGDGAIEYASQFVESLSIEEAMPVIKSLMKGELNDTSDKRVKRCSYCNYYWRDDSLRNTKKTCCDNCKKGIKTLQRREQREKEALLNPKPKKKTKRETNYVYWLEYPYWINEYEMLKQSWKYESPQSPTKINQIFAAKERAERIGGKQKPKRVVPYNGNEAEQPKTFVNFVKSNKKPGEVTVSHIEKDI